MTKLIHVVDYAHAKELIRRGRKPKHGRAIASWCRIYQTGDNISFLTFGKTEIGVLSPDNIFTFKFTSSGVSECAYGLRLHKVSNFSLFKTARRMYSVNHHVSQQTSLIFNGLQINYLTGEFLNPRQVGANDVDDTVRLEWLRCLRQYKRGLKMRAKLGVFKPIIDTVVSDRNPATRYDWVQPDWFSDQWLERLANAIKTQDFSLDLLKGLVQTSRVGMYNRQLTEIGVLNDFDDLIKDLSKHLRLKFGVFGDKNEMHAV